MLNTFTDLSLPSGYTNFTIECANKTACASDCQ